MIAALLLGRSLGKDTTRIEDEFAAPRLSKFGPKSPAVWVYEGATGKKHTPKQDPHFKKRRGTVTEQMVMISSERMIFFV